MEHSWLCPGFQLELTFFLATDCRRIDADTAVSTAEARDARHVCTMARGAVNPKHEPSVGCQPKWRLYSFPFTYTLIIITHQTPPDKTHVYLYIHGRIWPTQRATPYFGCVLARAVLIINYIGIYSPHRSMLVIGKLAEESGMRVGEDVWVGSGRKSWTSWYIDVWVTRYTGHIYYIINFQYCISPSGHNVI